MSEPAAHPALVVGPGEWLALSFADAERSLFGQARVEYEAGGELVLVLAALFAGGEALSVAGGVAPAGDATPGALTAGPLELGTRADGGGTARFTSLDGDVSFSLELEPAGERLRFPGRGFDQPCRVRGEIVAAGQDLPVDGAGQVGRGAGGEAGRRGGLERDVAAWLADGPRVALRAARDPGAGEHGVEHVAAALADADSPEPVAVHDARLSTTYDGVGHPLRAGLELWPAPDSDYPRRLAGEVVCSASLIGTEGYNGAGAENQLRWDIAFLDWRMEGRSGIGPYSLLRR